MSGNRAQKAALAAETIQFLNQGFYPHKGARVSLQASLQAAVTGSILYRPQDFTPSFLSPGRPSSTPLEPSTSSSSPTPSLPKAPLETQITFSSETTLQAARRFRTAPRQSGPAPHVIALNFASAKNPGGGFLGGSHAQEESLARSSGLYPCISQKTEMYRENRHSTDCAYFHYMVFSPLVPVFRKDSGELLPEPYEISFVTAPAPNAGVMRTRGAGQGIEQVMRERIDRILALCAHHRGEVLVLGAYGCGVFQNDINMVAWLFREALTGKYRNVFSQVHFAVPDRVEVFQRSFKA